MCQRKRAINLKSNLCHHRLYSALGLTWVGSSWAARVLCVHSYSLPITSSHRFGACGRGEGALGQPLSLMSNVIGQLGIVLAPLDPTKDIPIYRLKSMTYDNKF